MRHLIAAAGVVFALSGCVAPAAPPQAPAAFDLGAYETIDLTHAYGPDTVYWPTDEKGFVMTTLAEGMREDGFYAAFEFATAEHGGTHLDAPYHFAADGDKVAEIPLRQLIGPAAVIDVTEQASANRLYRLTLADLAAFEAEHGAIEAGSIVLLHTGWSERWGNREDYLGGTDPTDLAFPSFGEEAVRFLVAERGVAALGLDTASTDYGPSSDFPVHRVLGEANVPGFENLTRLGELPAKGALVVALPMKIMGGSGGPLRAIALVPRAEPVPHPVPHREEEEGS